MAEEARQILDVSLNVLWPLSGLIACGVYIYKTGHFISGIFLIWGAMVTWEFISNIFGIYAIVYAPSYSMCFQTPRNLFVMGMVGWMAGIEVSIVAMLIRYIVIWIKAMCKQPR